MPAMVTTSSALSQSTAAAAADDELTSLRLEVARLRALVGPSEESYEKLRLDVLGARDAALAPPRSRSGALRARVLELEVMIGGYERDFEWFRENAIRRLHGLRVYVPTVRRLARRAARR